MILFPAAHDEIDKLYDVLEEQRSEILHLNDVVGDLASQLPGRPLVSLSDSQLPGRPLVSLSDSQLPGRPLVSLSDSQLPCRPLVSLSDSQLPGRPLVSCQTHSYQVGR